jgi:outer membrane assembly lipoprotein YfgL
VFAASTAGTVVALDAATGQDVWRVNLGQPLDAGVGADGQTAAVITQSHDLVSLRDGQERWRVRLPARSFTAPLVAGERVFVLSADRTVRAFDGRTGARLWAQSRTAEPLVLSQPGVLLAVGDTLLVGMAGRLLGLNPINGAVRWEVPVATSRGANEVERLVDLVAPVSRVGNSVCVRAYSAAVGCVDAATGSLKWTRPAQGATGVHGDARWVYGTESDGRLLAWQRSNGDVAWTQDRLKYRNLTAPLALGPVLVVGDAQGLLHWLSASDGTEQARTSLPNGATPVAAPLVEAGRVLVQTGQGHVHAWQLP